MINYFLYDDKYLEVLDLYRLVRLLPYFFGSGSGSEAASILAPYNASPNSTSLRSFKITKENIVLFISSKICLFFNLTYVQFYTTYCTYLNSPRMLGSNCQVCNFVYRCVLDSRPDELKSQKCMGDL